MDEVLWYKCPNDGCLLWGRPVALLQGEDPMCPECGWLLSAMYPETEGLA